MSQETEEKLDVKLTSDREIAKLHAEDMKIAFDNWAEMTEEEHEKLRVFKYRCKCSACGSVNFSNDLTKVITDIPHTKNCDYKKGTPQTFNAEIN